MRVTSEGPTKITKAVIDAAWRRRGPSRRLIIRDKDCRGLALIVNASSMAWSYAYRPRGTDPLTGRRWPNRTLTVGNPSTHSPDDARVEANRVKGQAAAGGDPVAERKAAAEAAQRKRGNSLARLANNYERDLPKRPKSRGTGLPSEDTSPMNWHRFGWRWRRCTPSRCPQSTYAGRYSETAGKHHKCTRSLRCLVSLPGLVPGHRAHPGQPLLPDPS